MIAEDVFIYLFSTLGEHDAAKKVNSTTQNECPLGCQRCTKVAVPGLLLRDIRSGEVCRGSTHAKIQCCLSCFAAKTFARNTQFMLKKYLGDCLQHIFVVIKGIRPPLTVD